MSHSSVLKLTAILGLVFGLPLLLAPDALMAIYGSRPRTPPASTTPCCTAR